VRDCIPDACVTPGGWHWSGGCVEWLPIDPMDPGVIDGAELVPCGWPEPHTGLWCTRLLDHSGRHAAGAQGRIYAVWAS